MKKVLLLTLALAAVMSVGGAQASVDAWWAVDWSSPVASIRYQLLNYTGTSVVTAGIAAAAGREYADGSTALYTEYSPVFCVDLLHSAADNWGSRYNVEKYTGTDGIAGWITPVGDGDQYRSAAGLGRAAALAQRFGTAWTTTGSLALAGGTADYNDRATALNVAIWQAAYGSNFVYVSGLSVAQTSYFNTYTNYYNTGVSTADYTWWDSKVNDGASTNQDFLKGEVPEPSSLILLGTLLAGSGLLAIRRRNHSA